MTNRQQSLPVTAENEESAKKPRKRNPFMFGLAPDFLAEPRPLEFADGMSSEEFAYEKCARVIVEPLNFGSEKEWLSFAKEVWTWVEEAETRKKQALVEEVLGKLSEDAELLEILKKRLTALKA